MYKVVLAGKVASSNQVAWHLKQKKKNKKKKNEKLTAINLKHCTDMSLSVQNREYSQFND